MHHPADPNVTTVHLGRYTREHANQIAEQLEELDIVWWYKDPGYLSALWEKGVRLFVDRQRYDEAKKIADAILEADGIPPDAADPGGLLG
jgi:NAD(P)H-dependent FMN reductase